MDNPKSRLRLSLHWQILIGLLIGAIAGLIARQVWPSATGKMDPTLEWLTKNVAETLGQVFLRMIFMVVVPLVFSALTLGVAGIGDVRRLGMLGVRTLVMTLLLSSASVAIGLGMANLVKPGARLPEDKRIELRAKYADQSQDAVKKAASAKTVRDSLLDIIPRNPLQEMVGALDGSSPGGGMLAVMFFALVCGVAISFSPERTAPLVAVLEGIYDIAMVVIGWAMKLAPFGVAGLMFSLTATLGRDILQTLIWYVGAVLLALAAYVRRVLAGRVADRQDFPSGVFQPDQRGAADRVCDIFVERNATDVAASRRRKAGGQTRGRELCADGWLDRKPERDGVVRGHHSAVPRAGVRCRVDIRPAISSRIDVGACRSWHRGCARWVAASGGARVEVGRSAGARDWDYPGCRSATRYVPNDTERHRRFDRRGLCRSGRETPGS